MKFTTAVALNAVLFLASTSAQVCWKKMYSLGIEIEPFMCPEGYQFYQGKCMVDCTKGYVEEGPLCL